MPGATSDPRRDGLFGHVGDEGLVAEEHRLRQGQQRLGEGHRTDRPAAAKAGGCVGFGDRGYDNDPVGQFRHGKGRGEIGAVKDQILIDLIRDNPEVMFDCKAPNGRRCRRASAPRPVGLCGVVSRMALLCGVMRAAISPAAMRKPFSGRKGTGIISAPVARITPS